MPEENQWRPLFANRKGEVMESTKLTMLARSGCHWVIPERGEMIPLPNGASLVSVPGKIAAGWDGTRPRLIDAGMDGMHAQAVAALLPQGFTRTLLPAHVASEGSAPVPLYGYTAVGFRGGRIWAAAVQTDEHRRWHPRFYNTGSLPDRISRMKARFPQNRLVGQLAGCSLMYGCYTAQNIFYRRWEGGLPTMNSCNADCLGCISQNHPEVDSPQQRLQFRPTVTEIAELGLEHLIHARDGIISFGQGCEGEPSLNADDLAAAIRIIRQRTDRGTININTNAGYTKGIVEISQAGLDSMRVTLFSARDKNYTLYHRPHGFRLRDVATSILHAKDAGVKVSINLLTMPGFTDREDEIESLLSFVPEYEVDMVQLRNLNMDADLLFGTVSGGGESLGIGNLITILRSELPKVAIGSYTHPVR